MYVYSKITTSMSDEPKITEIKVHQVKSGLFRNIHVSGAFGGMTPQGDLHVALYSERTPIAQEITLMVGQDGTFVDEDREKRIQREGLLRELEVGLVMSPEVAEVIGQWLMERGAKAREALDGHKL